MFAMMWLKYRLPSVVSVNVIVFHFFVLYNKSKGASFKQLSCECNVQADAFAWPIVLPVIDINVG